jgi:hypothetical protein
MKWIVPQNKFGPASKRKPLFDEREASKQPSVHTYKPEKQYKVKVAVINKSSRISYLSDAVYRGKTIPGPN